MCKKVDVIAKVSLVNYPRVRKFTHAEFKRIELLPIRNVASHKKVISRLCWIPCGTPMAYRALRNQLAASPNDTRKHPLRRKIGER